MSFDLEYPSYLKSISLLPEEVGSSKMAAWQGQGRPGWWPGFITEDIQRLDCSGSYKKRCHLCVEVNSDDLIHSTDSSEYLLYACQLC